MDVSSIVEQVPSLAVLVFVVFQFLRHMEIVTTESEKRYEKMVDINSKSIEHLVDEISHSKKVNAKLAQIIMYHDATVKGVNSDSLGNPADFINKILNST